MVEMNARNSWLNQTLPQQFHAVATLLSNLHFESFYVRHATESEVKRCGSTGLFAGTCGNLEPYFTDICLAATDT